VNSSPTKQMTVLLLISSEGYYGVENMIVNLAAGLARLDCRCVLAVFHDSRIPHTEIADRARARGIQHELIPCSGRFDLRALAHLRSLTRSCQVDVVHSHGYKADIYASAAAAWSGTRLVATCHNWLGTSWNMRAYASLDRLCLRAFDRIAFVSDTVAQTLRDSGIPDDKLQMIPNGVDIERFEEAPATLRAEFVGDGEFVVGCVGRLVPDKGGDILLRAAQDILKLRPKTRFVLIGDGPAKQEWQSLAHGLGIANQVTFAGAREDMPAVYASLDILVHPSLCEAMPMCLLEAMAAGKAVIATPVGAVPKLVNPEQTGILVAPGDVQALASSILRLIDAPEERRLMGTNGRLRARENFSTQSMSQQYLELYQGIVAEKQDCQRTFARTRTV
jgi:glycosyltransferase involved in cell wall biosynthesis